MYSSRVESLYSGDRKMHRGFADRDCFEDSSRFMRFVTKAQSRARQDEEADRETSVRRLFCVWQPRATYARELVRSLARLIIQLISPRRSLPISDSLSRATCSPYSQQITTYLRGIQSLISSRPERALRARKVMTFVGLTGILDFKWTRL